MRKRRRYARDLTAYAHRSGKRRFELMRQSLLRSSASGLPTRGLVRNPKNLTATLHAISAYAQLHGFPEPHVVSTRSLVYVWPCGHRVLPKEGQVDHMYPLWVTAAQADGRFTPLDDEPSFDFTGLPVRVKVCRAWCWQVG